MYSDRTKRNFAVNVPKINTKTKEKNEANRQYEEYLNNYHASFENSPICLFNNLLIYTYNFCFGYIVVSCFFETFPGWLAGCGWLENPILMKTQSSVWTWTWTLDFDLGFVNITTSHLFKITGSL